MSTSTSLTPFLPMSAPAALPTPNPPRSEEHTSELQSQSNLVCRLLLEKKKTRARLLCVRAGRLSRFAHRRFGVDSVCPHPSSLSIHRPSAPPHVTTLASTRATPASRRA